MKEFKIKMKELNLWEKYIVLIVAGTFTFGTSLILFLFYMISIYLFYGGVIGGFVSGITLIIIAFFYLSKSMKKS